MKEGNTHGNTTDSTLEAPSSSTSSFGGEAAGSIVADQQQHETPTLLIDTATTLTTTTTHHGSNQSKKRRSKSHEDVDYSKQLDGIWSGSMITNDDNKDDRDGLEAYHGLEHTQKKLKIAEEENESKDRELERLRAQEIKSRQSITVRNHMKCSGNFLTVVACRSISSMSHFALSTNG
jgi:hypothetical protein